MGILEEHNKRRIKKGKLERIILNSVATVGVLSIGLIAPNVISAMSKLGIMPKIRQREYVTSSAAKLVKKKLLRFKDGYYQLTSQGEQILRLWNIDDYKRKRPKRWDEKWRMVILDIPEEKRKVRRQVSNLFRQAGLYRLQDSVWVYPHDCEDIIGLLKTNLGVGKDVLYIIADEIENDKYLRSHFDLNS